VHGISVELITVGSLTCAILFGPIMGSRRAESEWKLAVEAMPSPAGANSAQPQLLVEGNRAVLSWIERHGERAVLKVSERSAPGWSNAQTVVSGDDFFVNWADVPSIRPLADGTLVAHWLQKSGNNTYAYDVRLSWSRDRAMTWSAPTSPHHDGTNTEHGFVSLFQTPAAGVGLVWLDGRTMKPDTHGTHHTGNMSLRAAVYERDGMQRWEMLVDDRVCECCPTAAAVTSEGPIVAFRNRSDDEIRDIYVSRFDGERWTEPTPVHNDGWKIAACPVNGPALSASGRDVVVAWFTVEEGQGRVFGAFSSDAGRTFGAPIRIDDAGSLGRADVELLKDGSAAVTWIEFAEQRSQFRIRRVTRSAARSASLTIAGIAGSRASGYPRLAQVKDELLFAWTESDGNSSQVRTARSSLPPLMTTR
jgi:BNR repeat-like domain